ncbi:reverse transcriptase domain-containing protein [Tanacetum coccineum]
MTERETKQMPVYFVSRALQGLEINYMSMEKPRTSVKGQILADFIVERPEDVPLDTPIEADEELLDPWTLFTDGSSCVDGSGAGPILTNPKGAEFMYALWFRFDATNNEAEYEALIDGLRIAEQMGVKNLQTNVDSRLVANQVLVEELKEKSINKAEVLAVVEEEGDTWMTPIYNYLTEETFPSKKGKGKSCTTQVRKHACRNKIHSSKGHTDRILWPTMHVDARKLIRTCQDCQVHHPVPRNPQQKLNPIMSPWSFYKWGIDIAGPFPKGPEKVKFLKVAMDYCTTWIEAKPVATITGLIEELSHVLWAHRAMIKSSNGDTPFSLTYETEVVIPAEIGMPTIRTTEVDIVHNDEALEINLDLLEERREQATIREAKSNAKMEKYYNSKVRNTIFKPEDLVYRSNEASHAKESEKLSPKWEGPYEVTESTRQRSVQAQGSKWKDLSANLERL